MIPHVLRERMGKNHFQYYNYSWRSHTRCDIIFGGRMEHRLKLNNIIYSAVTLEIGSNIKEIKLQKI